MKIIKRMSPALMMMVTTTEDDTTTINNNVSDKATPKKISVV